MNWNCLKDWQNVDFLIDHFGFSNCPVCFCSNERTDQHESGQICTEMTLKQYLNDERNDIYLKDWHFQKEFENLIEKTYLTPEFAKNDWLNQYCDEKTNTDYRFVYIGKKNTWTPLHTDVLKSYSWSANVSGRKKW